MRTHCSYCRGNTTEDFYGNCSACGAPKTVVQTVINPRTSNELSPTYFPPSGSWSGYETYQQVHRNDQFELYEFERKEIEREFFNAMKGVVNPQRKHAIPEFVRSLLRR